MNRVSEFYLCEKVSELLGCLVSTRAENFKSSCTDMSPDSTSSFLKLHHITYQMTYFLLTTWASSRQKPVFGFSDKVSLKPVSSATETS